MRIGFIGTGNMASAMISGILQTKMVSPGEITGSAPFEAERKKVQEKFGIRVTEDNREAVSGSDLIVLAVKPQVYETVIREIKDVVTKEKIILTIAPGKTIDWLEEQFGKEVKIVRTLPNTPALVGAGMTAMCTNGLLSDEETADVMKVLESFGRVEAVDEHLMNAVSATSSASPAYIYILIEAMADGAAAGGIPRAQAYRLAAQTVLGSAKMVLDTGKHPGELKDMVCSPAGATIEAVRVLEQKGFRSAIIEAMKACEEKSGKL